MSRVSLHYLRVGQCQHLECVAARGGRLANIDFPSMCALIIHPSQGAWLFDTGYSEHFFTATQSLPEKLYRWALPVDLPPEQRLLRQLAELGVTADDVRAVVVSHYHGDHVAGLRDFPKAAFYASRLDSQDIRALSRRPLAATRQGKLPALLPDDYWQRLHDIEDSPACDLPGYLAPFRQGFDLVGDGSLIAVPLPGHSHGQMGLWVPNAQGAGVFLVADACWSLPACREGRLPLPLTYGFMANAKQYRQTFFQLATLIQREPGLHFLPSHCVPSWQRYRDESA